MIMADSVKFDLQFKKGILVCAITGNFDVSAIQKILDCPNQNPKNNTFIIKTDSKNVYSKIVPSLQELGDVCWNKTPIKSAASVSKFLIQFKKNGSILDMVLKSADKVKLEDAIDFLKTYTKSDENFVVKNGILYEIEPKEMAQLSDIASLAGEKLNKSEDAKEGVIHLNLADSIKVSDYLNSNEVPDHSIYEVSEEVEALIKDMEQPFKNEYAVPNNLKATPFSYQYDGYKWLSTLEHYNLGGILADDMGLGKTLQTITLALNVINSKPESKVLIVCPSSLVYNWQNEFEKFAPDIKVKVINGEVSSRQKKLTDENDIQVFITSYNTLHFDFELYKQKHISILIADEAQHIKNPDSQNAQCVKSIGADFKMAITGTPIENKLLDLWSIFDFILPGYLGTKADFNHKYNSSSDKTTLNALREKISPYILRRMKKDVLTELPEKTEEKILIQMSDEQQSLYNSEVAKLKAIVEKKTDEEFAKEKLIVLSELTKLRQICCAPDLIYENFAGENAKLSETIELVTNAIESGHKVLIFSQFTKMLDLIVSSLEQSHIKYYLLKGDTTQFKRAEMVRSFEKDDVPVFCISLKAGGTGLTLTAADIVIHFDPWWNVSAENQASDRAYRIGQKNPVTVYKMVCKDSIEEQIVKIQDSKQKLAETLLSGENMADATLTREDLLELLKTGEVK